MTCTIETITTSDALAKLAPVWEQLVTRSGATHPFVTHEWMQSWWEAFGSQSEMFILLVLAEGEPIAIAPLMRRSERLYGSRCQSLSFMANDHTPRCDFIVGDRAAEAYEAIGNFLMTAQCDVVRLHNVPSTSTTLEELASRASRFGYLVGSGRGAQSPVLPASASWDAYMETLAPKRRWFLRNRLKRLSKLGNVTLETISGGDDLAAALEDGFRLEAAAWKGAAGTAIQCDTNIREFYTILAQRAANRGWLRLQFLKVDDKRIAFAYCLAFANRMFLLKPGFDPEFAAYSPGTLLAYLALQELHTSGFLAYDFLGYGDEWKRQWTDHSIPHSTLFLYAKRPVTRLDHYTRFALMPRLRRARNLVLGNA